MKYATELSSCFDLTAREFPQRSCSRTGDIFKVPTGVFVKDIKAMLTYGQLDHLEMVRELGIIPEIQIRPRSGLAAKYGIMVANAPGTVDWDYPGEIQVLLRIPHYGILSEELKPGMRIAQATVALVMRPAGIPTGGDRVGGFGSTGR